MAAQATVVDDNAANQKRKPTSPAATPTMAAPTPVSTPPPANMGSMVNGVRTFSDGSGSVARTLSQPQLDSLGAKSLSSDATSPSSTNTSAPSAPASAGITRNLTNPEPASGMGSMVNGVRTFSDGSGSVARTLSQPQLDSLGAKSLSSTAPSSAASPDRPRASGYYGDPNSPGYNSGLAQVGRALARGQEDNAVRANPVGPPSLLTPPSPNNDLRGGVRVNPTNTDLANEGALRPASGNFSVSNPQPQVDAVGRVMPARASAAIAPATPTAAINSPSATDAAPTIATVTPQRTRRSLVIAADCSAMAVRCDPMQGDCSATGGWSTACVRSRMAAVARMRCRGR
jgi:hypothetical protein